MDDISQDYSRFFRMTRPGFAGLTIRPGFVIPIQDSTAPSKVVGITEHKGRLFVALETGVFVRGDDDVLRPLMFSTLDDEHAHPDQA